MTRQATFGDQGLTKVSEELPGLDEVGSVEAQFPSNLRDSKEKDRL